MLHSLRPLYEKHHGIPISDEALHEAVAVSSRYIADRFLPDKAIDLIDEAGSCVLHESLFFFFSYFSSSSMYRIQTCCVPSAQLNCFGLSRREAR